ncbi:hypothetical protein [uncultured Mucilaginibacter sp.]|uniref:hypothetical protein n=1 Tax=uncultured Mucilaginibacter sp. TaxID=797541 RepID=UPI0026288FC2|nr:hypothetical protein [uncultured Mucilaginibacter sp.]
MKQQEILRKIGGIIAELKEQHTYLEANGSSFNDLELELFMANANFLTDHIEILKKIHVQAKPAAAIVETPERLYPTKPIILDYFSEEAHLPFADDPLVKKLNDFSPIKEAGQEQAPSEPEPDETFFAPEAQPEMEEPAPFMIADTSFTAQKSVSPETEEAEHIFAEAEVEPVETQPEIEHQESPKPELFFVEEAKPEPVKPEPIPQVFIKPEPVKPEPEPVLTLNQRIAAQKGLEQPTAKAAVAGKSTQDSLSLISLNDKLLFIKELFNGYNLAYSEAINILNRYTNFEQAEQFLKANYATKNNWKDKPATSERFYDLLRKRFS